MLRIQFAGQWVPDVKPTVGDGVLDTSITNILIFGNVTLAGTADDLSASIGPLEPGRQLVIDFPAFDGAGPIQERTVWERTFGQVPVGSSLLMSDSEGQLSLADNQGDAASRLGLALDRPARIRAA